MISDEAVEAAAAAHNAKLRWMDQNAIDPRLEDALAFRAALEAAAPHMLAATKTRIVAHLEACGGDYDLRYSVSIRKLADDLVNELTRG